MIGGYMTEITEYNKPKNIVAHPWRRYFARMLDVSLYGILITFINYMILRSVPDKSISSRMIGLIVTNGLMIFIEPLLLTSLGSTFGKWVFGLKLRSSTGQKLTYKEGLVRTFSVFFKGMGLGIPFYNIYTFITSFNTCNDARELPWDDGCSYQLKDEDGYRIVLYIASSILSMVVTIMIITYSLVPVNRGNITPEMYYENVNDLIDFKQLDYGKKLNTKGEWIDKSNGDFDYLPIGYPDYDVTYMNGEIQKVVITIDGDKDIIHGYSDILFLSYSAFVGADQSVSRFSLLNNEARSKFRLNFIDYEFVKGNYHISHKVDIKGYHESSSFLIAKDVGEHHFKMEFTMEKTE